MTAGQPSFRALLAGLLVSLLVHAAVLLPALVAVLTGNVIGPGRLLARFEPDSFQEPSAKPPDEAVRLGLDESTASTMTWVGYDEIHKAVVIPVRRTGYRIFI